MQTQQQEATMVFNTVRSVAKKLEDLTRHNVPLDRSFTVLAARSKSLEEMVVIEVMKESFLELARRKAAGQSQADASVRRARIPSRALSR